MCFNLEKFWGRGIRIQRKVFLGSILGQIFHILLVVFLSAGW